MHGCTPTCKLTKNHSLERLWEGEAATEATNEIERRPMKKREDVVEAKIEDVLPEAPLFPPGFLPGFLDFPPISRLETGSADNDAEGERR